MFKYELKRRPGDREEISRDLRQDDLRVTEREWVLRNLTTRQYVRSDRLQEPTDPAPDWGPPPKSWASMLSSLKRQCKTLAQQIMKSQKEIVNPGLERDETFTLANMFLALICSAPNTKPRLARDAPQRYLDFEDGPWAGCAFEVIPLYDHLQS